MKTLPNGVTIFNSTPHSIRFWNESWSEPVEVETDKVINAVINELDTVVEDGLSFVKVEYGTTEDGWDTIEDAFADGADVVIGSIIAAEAYAGHICGMTPCEGYERVPPQEKRMNADKFTIF